MPGLPSPGKLDITLNPYQGLKQRPNPNSVGEGRSISPWIPIRDWNIRQNWREVTRQFNSISPWIPIRDWNTDSSCTPRRRGNFSISPWIPIRDWNDHWVAFEKPENTRYHLESLSGIETFFWNGWSVRAVSRYHLESLSGIETKSTQYSGGRSLLDITLNPYQGLKQAANWVSRVAKRPARYHLESLSGIETWVKTAPLVK